MLLSLMRQSGGNRLIDGIRAVHRGAAHLFIGRARPQLKGGQQLGCLSRAESMLLGKLLDTHTAEFGQAAVLLEQFSPQLNGAGALDTDSQENSRAKRSRGRSSLGRSGILAIV